MRKFTGLVKLPFSSGISGEFSPKYNSFLRSSIISIAVSFSGTSRLLVALFSLPSWIYTKKVDKYDKIENKQMRICLKNEYCINISAGRVYRLMKSMSLPKMSTVKPFIHKSKSVSDEPCKNILKQEFNQSEPNIVWVCDFTYIRAGGRFYYLCAILDLFSRKVIAYKLSNKIDTQLAIDTVNLAVAGRGTSEGIIFHTDRGESEFARGDGCREHCSFDCLRYGFYASVNLFFRFRDFDVVFYSLYSRFCLSVNDRLAAGGTEF